MHASRLQGGFTLPGEAGYEDLTLKIAKKWGADVIRDSDGTVLSDDILNAGYDIYSTICIIRDHNAWAKENKDKLLIEIYDKEKKDPHKRTLDYLCVLEAVPRCDALLANVTCGVVTYSLGKKQDFAFVDVQKIG